jgi:rhodanese-related sulfurtransferase
MPMAAAPSPIFRGAGFALIAALIAACATSAHAQANRQVTRRLPSSVNAAQLSESSHTPQALYLSARDTFALLSHDPGAALLIDVRTTGEVIFGGIASPATRNIPYLTVDPDLAYDPARKSYRLVPNPDFAKAVALLVEARHRSKADPIIVYCTLGERSAKAARLLGQMGYTSVYTMADGFDPDEATAVGPGWKRAGLPWSSELRPDQLYVSPTM